MWPICSAPTPPADPNAPPFEGLPVDLAFPDLGITDSHVRFRGAGQDIEADDLRLRAAFYGADKRFEVAGLDLDSTMVRPRPGTLALDGDGVWDDASLEALELHGAVYDTDLTVSGTALELGRPDEAIDLSLALEPLALRDIDAFVSAGLDGTVGGTLTARGTLAALDVEGTLTGRDGTDGRVTVDVVVDVPRPGWDGRIATRGLRIDHLLPVLGEPLPVTHADRRVRPRQPLARRPGARRPAARHRPHRLRRAPGPARQRGGLAGRHAALRRHRRRGPGGHGRRERASRSAGWRSDAGPGRPAAPPRGPRRIERPRRTGRHPRHRVGAPRDERVGPGQRGHGHRWGEGHPVPLRERHPGGATVRPVHRRRGRV